MSGNGRHEVQSQHVVEGVDPLHETPAVAVVDEDIPGVEQVSSMDDAEVRKIDDRVAVGVTAAHVVGLNLGIAQKHRCLIGVDDRGRPGLIVPQDVRAHVLVGDHLGDGRKLCVAAAVVPVVMGVQDVLDRFARDARDIGNDLVIVVCKLVVDHDDAVTGHPNADVAARPGDHVQTVGDFGDVKGLVLPLSKGAKRRRARADKQGEGHYQNLFMHGPIPPESQRTSSSPRQNATGAASSILLRSYRRNRCCSDSAPDAEVDAVNPWTLVRQSIIVWLRFKSYL